MKNLKKFLVIALATAFVVPVLDSCKKGEEDPALSLKSRKGRLKGEWTVDSYETTTVEEDKNTNTSGTTNSTRDESTEKFDGSTITITGKTTYTNGGTTTTNTWDVETQTGSIKYTIESDGTFSKEETISYTDTEVDTFGSTIYTVKSDVTETMTVSGTWDFNEGVGEASSKEKVLFFYDEGTETRVTTVTQESKDLSGGNVQTDKQVNTTTMNFTYTNVSEEVWTLVMLKSKEMKLDLAIGFTGKTTNKTEYTPHGGSTTTTTVTNDFSFSATGNAMLSKQ